MVEGKTSSGFEFKIDEGVLEDFLFMRAFKKTTSGKPEEEVEGCVDLVRILFNDESEEERYYAHVAEKYGGRVPVNVLGEELGEIISAVQASSEESKN